MMRRRCSAVVAAACLIACAGPLPDERRPRVLHKVGHEYPHQRRDLGIEGYVVVTYTVSAHGDVSEAEVLESFPPADEAFEKSALHSIPQWRFYPKREAGRNVEHRARAFVIYCLPDAKATQRPRLELCRGPRNERKFLSELKEKYADRE